LKFSLLRKERNGQSGINKAVLKGANLEVVRGLTIEQFSRIKSLYEAKLDPVLME